MHNKVIGLLTLYTQTSACIFSKISSILFLMLSLPIVVLTTLNVWFSSDNVRRNYMLVIPRGKRVRKTYQGPLPQGFEPLLNINHKRSWPRKIRIKKAESSEALRKALREGNSSLFTAEKYSLTFWASIELHPHSYIAIPAFGYNTEIHGFDWWRECIIPHGVTIVVTSEVLETN